MRIATKIACWLLCAASVHAASAADAHHANRVYLDGEALAFTLEGGQKGRPSLRVGPWDFGQRLSDSRPRDGRLNLYLVFPGNQHHADGLEEFDHNGVINALPGNGSPAEWDVYWVIVLDPKLGQDLRHEQELLLAAQSRFRPPDLFEFDDIPASPFLRSTLSMETLGDLARFRDRQGTLPRVAIIAAGFAIRASASNSSPPAN